MELISKLNSLPSIKKFKTLRVGDNIFSRKYGVGRFVALYLGDVIINFRGRKLRIPPTENDLSLVPDDPRKKQRSRIEIQVDGTKMGIGGYKKKVKAEYIAFTTVAEVLNMSKAELVKLCNKIDIEIRAFGRVRKIKNQDFLKLRDNQIIGR